MLKRHILWVFLCCLALSVKGQTPDDTSGVQLPEYTVIEYVIAPDLSFKVQQIDADSIAQSGRTSLAEVLRFNTGIFVKSYGGNGVATLSFRGTGSSHTNLYWNGLSLGSPTLGEADFSLINLDAGDDLSIRYGLASLVDGSGGLGGSIHLTNSVKWNRKLGANALFEYGSFNRARTSVRVGGGNEKIQAEAGFYYQSADNDFEYPNITLEGNPTERLQHSNWLNQGVYSRLYYRPNLKNMLSVKAWYNHVDRQLPGPITQTTFRDENLEDEMTNAVVSWDHVGIDSRWRVSTGISQGANRYSNNTSNITSENSYLSWQSNGLYKRRMGVHDLLELGFRARFDQGRSLSYAEDVNQSRTSAYATYKKKVLGSLHATALVRKELIDDTWSPLLGSIGLFMTTKKYGLFKANAARNYRYPSLNDLHWTPGGNPDLLPEESVNFEVGYRYLKRKTTRTIDFEITAFDNNVDNWILWAPNGNFWSPMNVKKVRNQGMEAEFRMEQKFTKFSIAPSISYAYTSSKNKEFYIENEAGEDQQLIYVPFHKVNGSLGVTYQKLSVIYSQQYTSKYFISTDNLWYMPAYSVADVTVNYKLDLKKSSALTIGFSARNIFDCDYQILPYRPEPGRNFSLRISYQLRK